MMEINGDKVDIPLSEVTQFGEDLRESLNTLARVHTLTTIEIATPDDQDDYVRLFGLYRLVSKVVADTNISKEVFQRFMNNPDVYRLYILKLEDLAVGFVSVMIHHHGWGVKKVCYIEDMYVHESIRKRGYGKLMIMQLRLDGRDENWDYIHLVTSEGNFAARALYNHFTKPMDYITYQIPVR